MELEDFITVGNKFSYKDVLSDKFYSDYFATKECGAFLESLRKYQHISKTDCGSLDERICALREMFETLNSQDMYQTAVQMSIYKKENQLTALKRLFDLHILRDKKELYNPEADSLFKSDGLLDLQNDLVYNFKKNLLLGKYVVEAIDPSHRFTVNGYIEPWQNQNKIKSFFLYLEENCKYDRVLEVEYFEKDKLEKCKITIKDGKLYTANGEPLTTDEREFLFILSKNNQFYGCYSDKHVKHTSLSLGASIRCGGAIQAKDGNLTSINLGSGHYFPSFVYLNKLVYYLKKEGVKIPMDMPVQYFRNFERQCITLKQAMQR